MNSVAREDAGGHNGGVTSWTFLTHHAHVLLTVAAQPDLTVHEVALAVGISDRQAVNILNDLEADGYLERVRRGRRNHYVLHPDRPMRHLGNSHHSVGDLIAAMGDIRHLRGEGGTAE